MVEETGFATCLRTEIPKEKHLYPRGDEDIKTLGHVLLSYLFNRNIWIIYFSPTTTQHLGKTEDGHLIFLLADQKVEISGSAALFCRLAIVE